MAPYDAICRLSGVRPPAILTGMRTRRSTSLALLVATTIAASTACGGSGPTPGPTPTACVISVPASLSVLAAGGPSAITVTTTSGCAWTATTGAAFLTITSGSSGTGAGTVTFTVAANTGAARAGVLTIGGQAVTVNQAAGNTGPAPLAFAPANPANGIVGVPYNAVLAGATGGVLPIHYQLDTAGGFPPIGLTLGPDGTLSGTPSIAGGATFGVCAVDATGLAVCARLTVTITEDPALGNWAGTTTLQSGCPGFIGLTNDWNGTVRRSAAGGVEIVFSSPGNEIFNDVRPASLTGNMFSFTLDFIGLLNFTATLSADRQSVSGGTFAGTPFNCGGGNVPTPSGVWTGRHQ